MFNFLRDKCEIRMWRKKLKMSDSRVLRSIFGHYKEKDTKFWKRTE